MVGNVVFNKIGTGFPMRDKSGPLARKSLVHRPAFFQFADKRLNKLT